MVGTLILVKAALRELDGSKYVRGHIGFVLPKSFTPKNFDRPEAFCLARLRSLILK